MVDYLLISIVSHTKLIYEGEAASVVITAESGELGILPNHIPLMAAIKPGLIKVKLLNGDEHMAYVSGGFLEVQPHRVIILADEIERTENLDETHIQKAVEKAKEKIHSSNISFEEKHSIELEIIKLTAQLTTIKRSKALM